MTVLTNFQKIKAKRVLRENFNFSRADANTATTTQLLEALNHINGVNSTPPTIKPEPVETVVIEKQPEPVEPVEPVETVVIEKQPEPAEPIVTIEQTTETEKTEAEKALRTLLATLTPKSTQKVELDESRIIQLIKEHAPTTTQKIVVENHVTTNTIELDETVHECFNNALNHLIVGNQLYFSGPSGAGKSTTARHLAQALEVEFFSQGALLVKFEALGGLTATGYNPSTIRRWLESEKGLLCIDEIDASDARALTTIMALFDDNGHGKVTFPDGVTLTRDPTRHYLVITGNTIGEGASARHNTRVKLDAAFLNRFVRIHHDYSKAIEESLANPAIVIELRKARKAIEKLGLNGSLITPRTMVQAQRIATTSLPEKTKSNMTDNLIQQGLTASEFNAVKNEMANG